jgi:hypothetical protein
MAPEVLVGWTPVSVDQDACDGGSDAPEMLVKVVGRLQEVVNERCHPEQVRKVISISSLAAIKLLLLYSRCLKDRWRSAKSQDRGQRTRHPAQEIPFRLEVGAVERSN